MGRSADRPGQFAVDIVKIDRSFIANVGSGNDAIVRAVVNLAHALDTTVIAEGMETIERQRSSTEMGCDAGQGFYFAQPMTADRIHTLLRAMHTAPFLPIGDERHGALRSGRIDTEMWVAAVAAPPL